MNAPPAQVPVEPPQITRHKRDTETPAEPDDDTLARDDSYMAERVADGMAARSSRPDASRQPRLDIDPYSTFGQWWTQLGRAMSNPAVREWAIAQGITDPRTISISPEKGEISFQTKPDRLIKTFGPGDKEWSAVSVPIMAAAKVIAAGSDSSSFHPALTPSTEIAPLSLVERFYGVPQSLSPNATLEYAHALRRDKTFPDAPSALSEVRSEEALNQQNSLLGNHITEHEAKRTLKFVFNHMQSNQLANSLIDEYLDGQMFPVHPDSTYPKDKQNHVGQTSLKQYVEHNGWKMPTNSNELDNLAAALLNPAPISPPNANYSGALAWPIPLDSASESHLKTILRQGKIGDIDLSPFKNVLEYLMGDMTPTYAESRNHPRQIIDKLIQSPKGQALGKAIQTLFDARSVKGSADDWLLAALSVHQDDKAHTPGTSPKASIAGRSFAVPDQVNRSASSFIFRLAEGQVFAGKASTLDKAWVQTHLLLSTRAPEFLVKDIPDKVVFGSHSWVSFATAVGRLEAIAPGSTATMNYADVMRHASVAPITETERQIEYLAQQEALKDWGAANGLPYPQTAAQMNTVREAFNAQVSELRTASEALSTPMPTGKDLALKYLTTAMPDMDPALFDKKCITASPVNLDYPGPYSLLDLYLKNEYILEAPTDGALGAFSNFPPIISLTNFGEPNSSRWVSSSSDVSITEFQEKYDSKQLPALPVAFDDTFSKYITTTEKGITTQIKYLISQQPPDLQKIIEDGEITILRKDNLGYNNVREGTSSVYKSYAKERTGNNLLLKINHKGREHLYEIDLKEGKFIDRSRLGDIKPGKYPLNSRHPDTEYVEVTPREPSKYSSDITHEKTSPTSIPYSFKSERSSYIADAYIKNLDLPELKNQAKGMTTFDSQIVLSEKINEFMLNLIPGRSAIVNFIDGKIVEGLLDLTIDALGFVVGIGAAVKGAKAASAAASALSKVLRTTKIVGRAAIGVLNPVDGVVDLLRGGAKLASKGFKTLTHTAGRYDLVAAAKHFDASGVGTFKLEGTLTEGPAVLTGGKWHAYDAVSAKPFGKPLEDFVPSMRAHMDELGDWATGAKTRPKKERDIIDNWEKTVTSKRGAANRADFDAGYLLDIPVKVPGFSKNMKPLDLMALTKNQKLTTEQVGSLVKQYDILLYSKGKNSVNHFHDSIHPIGLVRGIPQTAYLSLTSQFSNGQCAALSRAMATALGEGKDTTLIRNLRRAAAAPTDTSSIEFMRTLDKLQNKVSGASTFHAKNDIRQVTYQNMIKELESATTSKSVMIEMPGHAMTSGVKINGTNKTYYFYDPNLGSAEFSTAQAMERGLDKLFNNKKLRNGYRSVGTDPKKLEFKISDHNNAWQDDFSIAKNDFKKLYEAPI